MTELFSRSAYLPFIVLTCIGIYLLLSHRNYIKALVGLQVFQTGIILFFIIMAVRDEGTIPIQYERHHASPAATHEAGHEVEHETPSPATGQADLPTDPHEEAAAELHYDPDTVMHNPLPHALMLTAIVVGVATQGVGLAILRRIRNETGSIEDQEMIEGEVA